MKIFYCHYSKKSEDKLNRFEPSDIYQGVYFKSEIEPVNGHQQLSYADYFPHKVFGDQPIDEFLSEFKEQKTNQQKKLFYFLQRDYCYQEKSNKSLPIITFSNHQNWDQKSPIYAKIVKCKLHTITDYHILNCEKSKLQNLKSIRLDANGLFTKESFSHFFNELDPVIKNKIEYMEDPGMDLNWNHYPLPLARDFLDGFPFHVQIFKPNRSIFDEEWKNNEIPIIFSSYQGSDLGHWHCYNELLDFGNINLTHGIADKSPIFDIENDYYCPNNLQVKKMYDELTKVSWNYLCTI